MKQDKTYIILLVASTMLMACLPAYAATLVAKTLQANVTILASEETVRLFEFDWSDYTNNGKVTIHDVGAIALCWDLTPNSSDWSSCSYWDLTANNKIDIRDVATVALHWDESHTSPYPGQGLPSNKMDPNWRTLCRMLPEPHRTYCQTHI